MRGSCRFRPPRFPAIFVAAWCVATPSQAAQQQAGFAARVERVRIDVIVTTEDGEFVDDLALHELAIFEDGAPQEILAVQLVDLAAGTIAPLGPHSEPGSGGRDPAAGDAVSNAEQGPSLDSLGAIAFAIDARALGYWERRRFANGWLSFLEQSGPFTFPRSVYLITSELRELAPLTRDREVLHQVAAELREATYLSEESAIGAVFGEDHAQSPSRSSQRTLRELVSVVEALSARRGRKALVWVSPGVATSRMVGEGFTLQDPGARDAVERLVHAANAAGVSIYALDPTLVTKRAQYRPWTRITSREGPAEAIRRDPLERRVWYFDSLRDSLFAVSRQTGGLPYPFRVAVEETLYEIERDTSRFYLLAYAPPPPVGDGGYHEIEVRVARDDVEVRTRAGYVDGVAGQ